MAGKPSWTLDPLDPRAPSLEVWSRMTAIERSQVCDTLPSEIPRAAPSAGDLEATTDDLVRGKDVAERANERLARKLRELGVDPGALRDDET